MMKTRRKSKAAAAAAVEDEHEAGGHIDAVFNVNIPEDIDTDVLSSLLPEANFTSPTPEVILGLYKLILGQVADLDASQRDLDESRAEAEKKDVELDQALQDRETLAKEMESSLEAVQEDLRQVKQERDQLLTSNTALQTQLQELRNSQSSSSSEVDTLKHRVDDTEREKRDLLGVVSRLKQDASQREEEIQTLRTNLKEARQEHQALEARVRELRSIETSTGFKIDSLSQQLQLSQTEAERTNEELNSKTEEFAKYRRSKHTELATLQASYDSLSQAHTSMQATLKSLQSAHTSQSHQLTQALARVQDLTGQLAEQEATYASEASGLRRLVSMMEEREKQAKEIVEGIEREWAGVGERSERREATLRDEVERERKARESAEQRVDQLESVLERMGRGELPVPIRGVSGTPIRTPGTPGMSGDITVDGMMGLSPTVAMASRSQRSGKTFTEVYGDYVRLQDEYAKKSAEYDHMDRTLTAVLAQIEERAPILSQQRAEYERLQSESAQLASQLAQALSERDAQAHLAQENSQKLTKSALENDLLQKQLEDLGRQVQSLLREVSRRDDPTIPSDEELENMNITPAEDAQAVITNNLVLFKSIRDLQEQNQKLLKIVREMGRKMESEEKEYREAMEREQGEAVREAHEAMQELAAQLESQKKHHEDMIQAYVKERDALKSMLARAEKDPRVNGRIQETATGEVVQDDLAKELADVQNQFEVYRTEMGVDSGRLREDLVNAQREAGQLGAALAKANAKIEYLSDRQRMSQDQFNLHGRELDDLTKRNQQLFDQWTRVDIECSRVTEDLQIASGRVEQLRNECANLRAEKKIWESVQGRLVEENRTLAMERSHLSDLMGNVQKMHNDLERSGENDRRRLEAQLQMLEGQAQDLRTQLSQERDSVRHVTLQKEIDLKELQTRLDKTVHEFSKTRENLVGAETSKKHLEERVNELTKQLQGNEEKLAVYERRPSAANGVAQNVDQELDREHQLEAEVAELRSVLKVADVDLATARRHVQQFQEISQANEEALSNLNSTFDEYKTSTEAQVARHESDYNALKEKLQIVQEELNTLKAAHQEALKKFEAERATWLDDKKTLEATIIDMSTSEKHSESDRNNRESAVRQLEERTKAAEDRYSREVVAHAESIKSIELLNNKLNAAQTAARDNLTTAETANAKLAASEGSWKQQKESLDKEVADLNARCRDLASQNTILHQHLESVSSQAAQIRQAADASTSQVPEGDSTSDTDAKLSELRSVVTYLRKEKEIVDLQLELGKQENTRLKAQIEHLSQTLDDTRATLSEERERAVETAASAAQHAELLDRINQLNILRESNATLRADCENHAKRSRELEAKLKQLAQELDPAKEQARVAQAELDACKSQLKRLEDENRRWQERNSQLLTKYDRIDPAEIQALRDEIELLKTQKAELEQQKEKLEKSDARDETIATQTARRVPYALTKSHSLETPQPSDQKWESSIPKSPPSMKRKIVGGEDRHTGTREDRTSNSKATAEAEQVVNSSTSGENNNQASLIATLREERDKLLAEKAAWETKKTELLKARDDALALLKSATEKEQKALEDTKNLRMQKDKFQTRITELMKLRAADAERAASQKATAIAEAVEKAKTEQPTAPPTDDETAKRHAEELRSLEATLTEKHKQELAAAVEAAQKEKPTAAPNGDQSAAIAAAVAETEKKLQAKYTEEIASAVERGRMEQAAKGKLKDSQLVKAQKKVKDLEAQILEWTNAGILPATTSAPAPTAAAVAPVVPSPNVTAVPQTPKNTVAPQATHQATPKNTAAPQATPQATPNASTSLPRKPSMNTPGGTAVGVGRGAGAGRGQPLRVPPQRAGPGAPGLGRAAPPKPPVPAPATGGVSIMGAAGKRAREETTTPGDDTLAKRLKPAEPANKPPVALRRPPPS
ncbi:hypothetical protein BD779DRAFT_1672932 [Infundibulicybe gibba]|nr:hypothetical protein BD779DRAFT_1672932 [Infundibulicybe gibba]